MCDSWPAVHTYIPSAEHQTCAIGREASCRVYLREIDGSLCLSHTTKQDAPSTATYIASTSWTEWPVHTGRMNFMNALETTSETANTSNPQTQKYRSERLFTYNLTT